MKSVIRTPIPQLRREGRARKNAEAAQQLVERAAAERLDAGSPPRSPSPPHPYPKAYPPFSPHSYPTPYPTCGPYHLDPMSSYMGHDVNYPQASWSPVILPPSTDRTPPTRFQGTLPCGLADEDLTEEELLALKKTNQAACHSFHRLPPEDGDIDVHKLKESIRKEFREHVRPAIHLRLRPATITEFTKTVQNVEHVYTKAINAGAEYLMQLIYVEDHLHPKLLRESSSLAKKILMSLDPAYVNELATLDQQFADDHKRCPRTIMAAICDDLTKYKKFVPQLLTDALDAVYGDTNVPNLSLLDILQKFNAVMAQATNMGIDRTTINSEAVRALGEVFKRNRGIKDEYNAMVMLFQGDQLPPLNENFPAHIAKLIQHIQLHTFISPTIERPPASEVHPHTVDVNFTQPQRYEDRRRHRAQEWKARPDHRHQQFKGRQQRRSPYQSPRRQPLPRAPVGNPAVGNPAAQPLDPFGYNPPTFRVYNGRGRAPVLAREPNPTERAAHNRSRRFNMKKSFNKDVNNKRRFYFLSSSSSSSPPSYPHPSPSLNLHPQPTPHHQDIKANLTIVHANQTSYIEPILQGVYDSGATRTVTPLLEEMTNIREENISIQGYGTEHNNNATKTGMLRGIPAVYDPNARQTLYAPRDIMKVQHSCMIYTTGSLFMVDEQDCKAWLEKMRRSKRILQEIPVDSRGLYSGNLPSTFVRDPFEKPRHLDWTGTVPSWTGTDVFKDDMTTAYNVIADNGITIDAPPSTPHQEMNAQQYHCYTAEQIEELDNSIAEHIRWFDQHIKQESIQRHQVQVNSSNVIEDTRERMHKIMGHFKDVDRGLKGAITDKPLPTKTRKERRSREFSHPHWCEICQLCKLQNPIISRGEYPMPHDLQPMDQLYIDSMEKVMPYGPLGIKHIWIITDRKTKHNWEIGSADKSDHGDFMIQITRFFKKYNSNPSNRRIKGLHFDGDGVFKSEKMMDMLRSFGITPMPVPSHQHFLNGQVERNIQTLRLMANSYRQQYQVPTIFQYFAVRFAVWAYNRLVHAGHDKSPHEQLHGEAPDLTNAFVPFCQAYILTYDNNKEKVHARPGFFIGYTQQTTHRRCYDLAYYTNRPSKRGESVGRLEIITNRYAVVFNEQRGFGDIYPRLADKTSNEILQMIHTNHGEKMKWVAAAYKLINEVNIDGETAHQADDEDPNIIIHQFGEPGRARGEARASAYIPPDADFDDMQIPASTAEGVIPRDNDDNNTHVRGMPPPISTIDFKTPYQCPCGHYHKFIKANGLTRHWQIGCKMFKLPIILSDQTTNNLGESHEDGVTTNSGTSNIDAHGGEDIQIKKRFKTRDKVVDSIPPPHGLIRIASDVHTKSDLPGLPLKKDVAMDETTNVHETTEGNQTESNPLPTKPSVTASITRETALLKGNRKDKRKHVTFTDEEPAKTDEGLTLQRGRGKDKGKRKRSISPPPERDNYNRHKPNHNTTNHNYNTRTHITEAFIAMAVVSIMFSEHQSITTKKRDFEIKFDPFRAPKSRKEIDSRPDKQHWYDAITVELSKHIGKKIDMDTNRIPTFHKVNANDSYSSQQDLLYNLVWRFDLKTAIDDKGQLKITKYKARLAIDGSGDVADVDFDAMYGTSRVVAASTTRVTLSYAAKYKLTAHQFDVAGAYLYGRLPPERRVFIQAPALIDNPALGVQNISPGDICRVDTALYGLPDSGGIWSEKLLSSIASINLKIGTNFKRLEEDPGVLIHRDNINEKERVIMIPIYVDDLRIYDNDIQLYNKLMKELHILFELDDRTTDEIYLGMSVKREGLTGAFNLSCDTLITKTLNKHHMEDVKIQSTPIIERPEPPEPTPGTTSKANLLPPDKYKTFRGILGAISFIATACRPDISFATNRIAKKQSNPNYRDLDDLIHLLGYLKGTKQKGIRLKGDWEPNNQKSILTVYTDASYADIKDDKTSSYGYVAYLGTDMIIWCSTTTKAICRSSAESELYAIDKAVMLAIIPLTKLLKELKIPINTPPLLRSDNQAALDILKTGKQLNKIKHTQIRIHYLRDQHNGTNNIYTNQKLPSTFNTLHISGLLNGADIFTKILAPTIFFKARSHLYHNHW